MSHMYHDIINVNQKNIDEVTKFVAELSLWQQTKMKQSESYECFRVLNGYIQTNMAMYIMMNIISFVYGYRVEYIDACPSIEELDNLLVGLGIDAAQALNGLQREDSNINMFYDIVYKASAFTLDDSGFPNMLLHSIHKYMVDIRHNLPIYTNTTKVEYIVCIQILEAINIICKDNIPAVSDTFNMISCIANTIVSNINNFTSSENEDYCRYAYGSEIPYLLYSYIIPVMCLNIHGLCDILEILKKIRWYDESRSIQ